MPRTLVVAKSANSKLGVMGATYRTQDTCPTDCPFFSEGCYARGRIFYQATKHGREDLEAVYALVESLPLGGMLRLNVSGDFLDEAGEVDTAYIEACNDVVRRRPDIKVIAYTHAWRQMTPDLFAFTVNASCETPEELLEALTAGWQAVVVDGELGSYVGGRQVIQCPQQTRGVTCAECGACAADTRTRPVISFAAHGSASSRVSRAVESKRLAA